MRTPTLAMPNPQSTLAPARPAIRLGSVSFLNAKPLIYGLKDAGGVDLALDVPSRLLAGLHTGRFDVALLPIIDYQRLPGLLLVPGGGGIGCDGPTLTVRLFSKRPIDQVRSLACDTDSHTSVALARVLFAERFGTWPQFLDLVHGNDSDRADARLLIGDKVVCEEPPGFDYQLDLGHAWKQQTGLPFVFAAWVARPGIDLGDLPDRLARARADGLAHVDELIARHAIPRGWPAGMALQYLTLYLKFTIAQPQLDAIRLFHDLAAKHGVIPAPPRSLELYAPPT